MNALFIIEEVRFKWGEERNQEKDPLSEKGQLQGLEMLGTWMDIAANDLNSLTAIVFSWIERYGTAEQAGSAQAVRYQCSESK